jgi:hypothetical protein
MAKNGNDNGNDKDMSTGRPCKDPQMHALKSAHGTATRQSELPPYISKKAMPHDPDETD